MKRVTVWCVSAFLSMSLAAVLVAQAPALDVKMGLWEVTSTTQIGGQMPAIDTSKMTPEQKARMEELMKGAGGARTSVSKSCWTKEKFEKSGFMAQNQPGQTCQQTLTTNTRTSFEGTFTCTGQRPTTGQMRFDALSTTTFKGVIKSATTTDRGGALNVDIAMAGKWLGADCGSEK